MAKYNDKLASGDVDRLKRIAFWYWEYMRRNKLYKAYCTVINRYNDCFKRIGVYDYMQTKAYLDEMSEYVSNHDNAYDLKYTSFRRRLEKEHGENAGRLFFKYGFLSNGYEKKFGRVYKDSCVGMDTYEALNNFLDGQDVPFKLSDLADISALIRLNGEWVTSVEGERPSMFTFDANRLQDITLDREAIFKFPDKVGLELHALNLINKTVACLFEKQRVGEDTLQAVYKLSLAGRHINSTDAMRLAMLWLWDKAHEKDEDSPIPFDEVYPLLKRKIEKAGMADGAWEQIVTRRKRIAEYYEVTSRCIKQCIVTSLNQ